MSHAHNIQYIKYIGKYNRLAKIGLDAVYSILLYTVVSLYPA
jgi:hypothetical protein